MIEPLSQATQTAALEFLARAPYLNVFISHVLLHDPAAPERKGVVVAACNGRVAGVAYYGRQLAIAAEPQTLRAFAEHLRHRPGEHTIAGARETVSALWDAIASWHPAPRLVRDRQLVMMIDRTRLRRGEFPASVDHATVADLHAVAASSAAMVRQELAYDLRPDSPEFTRGIRRMIDRNLWWVGRADGRLCFFCNVGPWCAQTLQLQGVWTPPALRRRGLATASLAAICDRLLETSPTLSLYVNDFNDAAIALYRRVGFEHVGDFRTMLF